MAEITKIHILREWVLEINNVSPEGSQSWISLRPNSPRGGTLNGNLGYTVYFCTQAVKVSVNILVLFIQIQDLAAPNPAHSSSPRELAAAANNSCKGALAQQYIVPKVTSNTRL